MPSAKTFNIGGSLPVSRLGYGAMRIVGAGFWGPPPDHNAALAVLRRARDLGVDFFDTADSYGPYVSEELLREALHPYPGLHVATKAGLVRPGPQVGLPPVCGKPDYLRQELEMSMRRLGVDHLDLWQLHRIDPDIPAADQFGVLKEALDSGRASHVGLSRVTIDELRDAQQIVPISTVQNLYNVANRQTEPLLRYCEENAIAFIAYFPLAAGDLAKPGGAVADVAARHHATTGQIALAWLLQRSPNLIAIPGTSSITHLEENLGAANLTLTHTDLEHIDGAYPIDSDK